MPGVQWLELLCKHVPHRHERHYGRCSSRTRGSEHARPDVNGLGPETSQARQAAKAAWAKMIRKVYELDPLACPACGAQMWVIALIQDPGVIERILSWLGLWDPPQPCPILTWEARRAAISAGATFSWRAHLGPHRRAPVGLCAGIHEGAADPR